MRRSGAAAFVTETVLVHDLVTVWLPEETVTLADLFPVLV